MGSSSFKLNVDASLSDNGECGIGAVIRNEDGHVLAATTWKHHCMQDQTLVEVAGVRLGMNFAINLLFLNLVVESNSLIVIQALKGKKVLASFLGSLVSDCNHMKAQISNISFSHIGRSRNMVAHLLAKYA